MLRNLHWLALVLLVLALAFDFTVWGGAARLPDVGPLLLRSAQREAPVVRFYMLVGQPLDAAVSACDRFGQDHATAAFSDGFQRIKDEPAVAMDLIFSNTWNSSHATIKTVFWATPVLVVLWFVFWLRRPKKVSLMSRRR
jgi:hypothetical protein